MTEERLTLAHLLVRAGPSRPAVILPDETISIARRLTFQELVRESDRAAGSFRGAGLAPGDAVAIVLPNGLEFLASFLGATTARLIAAPLNCADTKDELRFSFQDANVRAVIACAENHSAREVAQELAIPFWTTRLAENRQVLFDGPGLGPISADWDAARPGDVALFLHTSGTTSRPKGVPLTHANLMASVRNIADHYRLGPDDVGLVVMPQFHVHGLIGATLSPLWAGGAIVVPPKFSAHTFWPIVHSYAATWYTAVPTVHQVLLMRADQDGAPRRSSLRFIRSCSSALAPATLAQLEARFGTPVLEAYAMTEASHQMTANPLPPGVHKPGSVGRGVHVDVAIMDEAGTLMPVGTAGEVVVRGPNITAGYQNNPDANRQAFTGGWFRTGDRGVLDDDGYLFLIGRIKELINRGGEKISPLEVDSVLLMHPAVAEAAAFGVSDAKYGEEIHAAVVLKAVASAEELQAHCRLHLAEFKTPREIHFVEQLPHTASGKVQRHLLAALLARG